MAFVQTVWEMFEGFTEKEIAESKLVYEAQGTSSHSYDRDFKYMVRNNIIKNFPITDSDVTNSHTMFGPNLASTRVKTVRHNRDRVMEDYVAVTRDFLKLQKFLTLVEDVMFVNGA